MSQTEGDIIRTLQRHGIAPSPKMPDANIPNTDQLMEAIEKRHGTAAVQRVGDQTTVAVNLPGAPTQTFEGRVKTAFALASALSDALAYVAPPDDDA